MRLSVNVDRSPRCATRATVASLSLSQRRVCVELAGAPGITVHPRADRRHITPRRARSLAASVVCRRRVQHREATRAELTAIAARRQARPVHARARSAAARSRARGDWTSSPHRAAAGARVVHDCRRAGVRVSLFVDPDDRADRLGRALSAPTASSSTPSRTRGVRPLAARRRASFARVVAAAAPRADLGLGVQRRPRPRPTRTSPIVRDPCRIDEVTIGHASSSQALFVGLDRAVREMAARSSMRARRHAERLTGASRALVVALVPLLVACAVGSARAGAAGTPPARPSRSGRPTASPARRGALRGRRPARAGRGARAHAHALAARLGGGRRERLAGGRHHGAGDRPARARRVRRLVERRRRPAPMALDVAAAVAFLAARPDVRRGAHRDRGASLGANLAVLAAAADARGREPRAALARRSTTAACASRPRCGSTATGRCCSSPSADDPYALRTVRGLPRGEPGCRRESARCRAVPATARPCSAREPDLDRPLVDWFRRTLL